MHMKMTERQVGNVTLLDLVGNLTIDEDRQSLKDKIYSLIQQGRTQVLVNLAHVPYIDSAGLGQLVASYTSLTRANGSMKLLHANSKNQHLLDVPLIGVSSSMIRVIPSSRNWPLAIVALVASP